VPVKDWSFGQRVKSLSLTVTVAQCVACKDVRARGGVGGVYTYKHQTFL